VNPNQKKRKKQIAVVTGILVMAAVFLLSQTSCGEAFKTSVYEALAALNHTGAGTKAVVAIDAGHGGFDPGKVGTAGVKEKDINLAIALKTEKLLKDSGYTVIMTREEDEALCSGDETNKKMTDLKNRVLTINQAEPAVAVSIHQNSYSASTKGAQVFYYEAQGETAAKAADTGNLAQGAASGGAETAGGGNTGKRLASVMQNTLREWMGDGNERVEKGNSSYYMLKNVSCPFVIVECGFLSNPQEEEMLCKDEYQQKISEAICEGIENFLYK
jgi:N-acetylmuramoyl-L-alanine amidase